MSVLALDSQIANRLAEIRQAAESMTGEDLQELENRPAVNRQVPAKKKKAKKAKKAKKQPRERQAYISAEDFVAAAQATQSKA